MSELKSLEESTEKTFCLTAQFKTERATKDQFSSKHIQFVVLILKNQDFT